MLEMLWLVKEEANRLVLLVYTGVLNASVCCSNNYCHMCLIQDYVSHVWYTRLCHCDDSPIYPSAILLSLSLLYAVSIAHLQLVLVVFFLYQLVYVLI